MSILNGLIKVFTCLVVLLGATIYVIVNYSAIQTHLICSGSWAKGPDTWQNRPETISAVLEEYTLLVIWSKSHGNLRAQARELNASIYLSQTEKVGSGSMAIYQFRYTSEEPIVGTYRASFKDLELKYSDAMIFRGDCDIQS